MAQGKCRWPGKGLGFGIWDFWVWEKNCELESYGVEDLLLRSGIHVALHVPLAWGLVTAKIVCIGVEVHCRLCVQNLFC